MMDSIRLAIGLLSQSRFRVRIIAAVAAGICSVHVAHAADWFPVRIEGLSAYCMPVGERLISGQLQRGRFIPYTKTIRRLKKSIRHSKSSSATYALIRTRVKLLSARMRLEEAVCELAQRRMPLPEYTPTPIPTIAPQPTVPATPTRFFDSAGMLTAYGKQQLSVPQQFDGSISVGATSYSQRCVYCHGEYGGRTFPAYRTAISGDPMYFIPAVLGDNELAHLTAYLNRFRE